MLERFKKQTLVNGWIYFGPRVANWARTICCALYATCSGPGWNLPDDAVYPVSEQAPDGKDYDGNNKYVIRFQKGQMPPINGFSSLTMYQRTSFSVPNALNRYTLSQRAQSLSPTPTAQSTSICRRIRPAGTRRRRTGRPLQKPNSASCCASTGRTRHHPQSLTARGGRRRSKRRNNRTPMTWAEPRSRKSRISQRRSIPECQ